MIYTYLDVDELCYAARAMICDMQKFKKISKRTLPNVGMGGWMEALADKVNKQGEHIPQHCYISDNHPYISSSGY